MGEDLAAEQEEIQVKNPKFTQVYPKGWDEMMSMMKENTNAARLFAFIAKNMDPDGGALVASQAVLAEALEVAEITIRRASKWLEDRGQLVRVRVGASVYAYALDPEKVWKTFHKSKDYAVFTTRTLVSKKDRHNATIDRRIKVMTKEAAKPSKKIRAARVAADEELSAEDLMKELNAA